MYSSLAATSFTHSAEENQTLQSLQVDGIYECGGTF